MIALNLTRDTITPALRQAIRDAQRPVAIYGAGAKAVVVGINAHLRNLQARGNQMGWPSQKFFAGGLTSVLKSVGVSRLDGRGATISIADPRFVHRITGGEVRAKRRKNLTIPLNAEAYALGGKGTLRETAPELFPVKIEEGLFLCRALGQRGAKGLQFMFRLTPRVTHSPHPEEQPDATKLSQAALSAMLQAARILFRAS